MEPQKKKEGWEKDFDEKFLYFNPDDGKTTGATDAEPEEIKDFIRSLLTGKQLLKGETQKYSLSKCCSCGKAGGDGNCGCQCHYK